MMPPSNHNSKLFKYFDSIGFFNFWTFIPETAGLLPAKYYLSLHQGWDVRENLFMRQKFLDKLNTVKKDLVEEEGYQADQPDDYIQAVDNSVEPQKWAIIFGVQSRSVIGFMHCSYFRLKYRLSG